jgi:hypothetical protein
MQNRNAAVERDKGVAKKSGEFLIRRRPSGNTPGIWRDANHGEWGLGRTCGSD